MMVHAHRRIAAHLLLLSREHRLPNLNHLLRLYIITQLAVRQRLIVITRHENLVVDLCVGDEFVDDVCGVISRRKELRPHISKDELRRG